MNFTLLIVALSVFMLAVVLLLKEANKNLERYVAIMTGTTQDKAVDEYFMKAAIISADMYRNDKATGLELERKIIERACVIVSDVLMQHGISPRKYNLEGLTRHAMLKLGMIALPKRKE